MGANHIPKQFLQLQAAPADMLNTPDGFWLLCKSLAELLAEKEIFDVPDSSGERLACSKFYDDWFLYAVPGRTDVTYSLLKLREQEHDAEDGSPADGDAPGVTICFIAFDWKKLLRCLEVPTDENRKALSAEINRVVAHRGQRHHEALKWYFRNPLSQGAYLVAHRYTAYIAAFARDGQLEVPVAYKERVQQSISYKNSQKLGRLPSFVAGLNPAASRVICDNEKISIENRDSLTAYEAAAILATHTGNTSTHSFAAEVEYHARYLTPLAKIKVPFFGRSIYDSAIRADMTVDAEFQGPAPFYQEDSKIVKRQRALHQGTPF